MCANEENKFTIDFKPGRWLLLFLYSLFIFTRPIVENSCFTKLIRFQLCTITLCIHFREFSKSTRRLRNGWEMKMFSLNVEEEMSGRGIRFMWMCFFNDTKQDEISANENRYCVLRGLSSKICPRSNNVTSKGYLLKNKQKRNLGYWKNTVKHLKKWAVIPGIKQFFF